MAIKQKGIKEALCAGVALLALLLSGMAHANRGKDCILDNRFFVQMESTVGSRPFVATVEPSDSAGNVSRSAMCSCAKAITWLLLEEYNEQYPAAHLRGVSRGGCENYGDGGQMYKLYWRQ